MFFVRGGKCGILYPLHVSRGTNNVNEIIMQPRRGHERIPVLATTSKKKTLIKEVHKFLKMMSSEAPPITN